MRPAHTRPVAAFACAAAVVLSVAGCGSDKPAAETGAATSSSSTPSPEPTYDKAYAFAEAKKIEAKRDKADVWVLPKDTPWATTRYITDYNKEAQAQKKAGVTEKGKVSNQVFHLDKLDRKAKGGWRLSIYECSTSSVRYYKGDEDVTVYPWDTSKPMPKGPRNNVHRIRYVSTDKGKTWQVDVSMLVYGDEVKETPCAT